MTETSRHDASERLRMAVERGTGEDRDRWAATGIVGLGLLRDVLTGEEQPRWESVHPRDGVDNLAAATAAIADAYPIGFLDVFADPVLDANSLVLTGLGQIDDPRATARLAQAVQSHDPWLRMEAAIGLGRRRSPIAVSALLELVTDADPLVRHHALESLAAVGDHTALRVLQGFEATTPSERRLAEGAIRAIESGGRAPSDPAD